jgi:hypothetical protein
MGDQNTQIATIDDCFNHLNIENAQIQTEEALLHDLNQSHEPNYEIGVNLSDHELIHSIAKWCTGMLATKRDHDILCYVDNMRSSRLMIQMIAEMVQLRRAGNILKLDKNEMLVFKTNLGYENSVYVYAAKPEILRGTGSKRSTGTVILSDRSRIDPQLAESIIVPSLARTGINIISIYNN